MPGWLRSAGRRAAGLLLPARQAPPAPPPQPAGASDAKCKGSARRGGNVLVAVLDLTGESLEQVLDMVGKQCAANGTRPVFVTESMDLLPFRLRRLAVEQVVDAEARAVSAPELPWRLYRARQLRLIRERWKPVAVVSFGRRPGPELTADARL